MVTKKITLNELRSLVKQIIKEESENISKLPSISIFDNINNVLPVLEIALKGQHWGAYAIRNNTFYSATGRGGSDLKVISPFTDEPNKNFKNKFLELVIKYFPNTKSLMTYESLLHDKDYDLIKKYFKYFKPFIINSLESYQQWEIKAMKELFDYLDLEYMDTYTFGHNGGRGGDWYKRDKDAHIYNKQQIENL